MRLLRVVAIAAVALLVLAVTPCLHAKIYRLNYTFNVIPTAGMTYAKVYGNVQAYLPTLALRVPALVIKLVTWRSTGGVSVVKVLSACVKNVHSRDEIINILRYTHVSVPTGVTYRIYRLIKIVYVPFGFYVVAGPIKALVELPNGTLLGERDISLQSMNVFEQINLNPMVVSLNNTSSIVAGHVGNIMLVFYGKVYADSIEKICENGICRVNNETLLNFTMYIPLSGVEIVREGYKVNLFVVDKATFAKEFISAILHELSIVTAHLCHCHHCCHHYCHHCCHCCCHCHCCHHVCTREVEFENSESLWRLATILESFVKTTRHVNKTLRYVEYRIEKLRHEIESKYESRIFNLLHIYIHLYAGWVASAGDVLMIPISQMLCLYTNNAPVSSCSYENGYNATLSGFETKPYYKAGLAVALLWYYGHVPCYWMFIPFIGPILRAAQRFAIHVLREICSTADEVLNVSVGNMKGQICIWYIEEGKLKVNLLLEGNNKTSIMRPEPQPPRSNSSIVVRQLEVNVTSPIFGQRMLEFNITNHTANRLIKLVVRLQLENLPQSGAPVNVNVTIIPESENLIPEVVTSSSIVPNVTSPSVAESCSSVVEGNIVKILCKVNVTESNTILVIPPRSIYLTFRLENTDSANYKMVLNVEVNGSEREIGRSIDVLKLSGNVLANVTFNRLTIMINLTNVPSDIRYILSSNYVKAVLRCSNFGLIAPAILSDRFIIVNLPLVPELLTLTSNRCTIKLVANTTGKVLLKYRVNIVPLSALVSSVRINGRNVILTFSRPVENITIAGADCREGRKCVLSGIRTVIMPKSVKCGENTICVPTPLKIATLIR